MLRTVISKESPAVQILFVLRTTARVLLTGIKKIKMVIRLETRVTTALGGRTVIRKMWMETGSAMSVMMMRMETVS